MAVARHSDNIEVQDEDQDESETTITARTTNVEMSERYERLDLQKKDDAVYEEIEDLGTKTKKDKGLPKILQSGRRPLIVVAVCLGMLCLILLGVNIVQAVLYKKSCCPSGWTTFEDSCYYRTTEKTWQESRDYCLKKGADLVVINSREEQVFIRGWNPGVYASRIGLTRTEGRWTWVDGTPLTTQYWDSGYPLNDEDMNCAAYSHWTDTGTWFNTLCSSTRASICEKWRHSPKIADLQAHNASQHNAM